MKELLSVVHPKNRPLRGPRTAQEIHRTIRFPPNLAMVENCFSHICFLWIVIRIKLVSSATTLLGKCRRC